MKTTLFFALLFVVFAFTGCGPSTPAELKNLAPVKITVVNKGEPLADVLVLLYADTTALLARGGTTDANGVAIVKTTMQSLSGIGTQPGDYTVTLSKHVPLPLELQERENEIDLPEVEKAALETRRSAFYDKNRLVPLTLGNARISPIKLTVAEKTGAELKIDVAEY